MSEFVGSEDSFNQLSNTYCTSILNVMNNDTCRNEYYFYTYIPNSIGDIFPLLLYVPGALSIGLLFGSKMDRSIFLKIITSFEYWFLFCQLVVLASVYYHYILIGGPNLVYNVIYGIFLTIGIFVGALLLGIDASVTISPWQKTVIQLFGAFLFLTMKLISPNYAIKRAWQIIHIPFFFDYSNDYWSIMKQISLTLSIFFLKDFIGTFLSPNTFIGIKQKIKISFRIDD